MITVTEYIIKSIRQFVYSLDKVIFPDMNISILQLILGVVFAALTIKFITSLLGFGAGVEINSMKMDYTQKRNMQRKLRREKKAKKKASKNL